jgi:hypothetical protein
MRELSLIWVNCTHSAKMLVTSDLNPVAADSVAFGDLDGPQRPDNWPFVGYLGPEIGGQDICLELVVQLQNTKQGRV